MQIANLLDNAIVSGSWYEWSMVKVFKSVMFDNIQNLWYLRDLGGLMQLRDLMDMDSLNI